MRGFGGALWPLVLGLALLGGGLLSLVVVLALEERLQPLARRLARRDRR